MKIGLVVALHAVGDGIHTVEHCDVLTSLIVDVEVIVDDDIAVVVEMSSPVTVLVDASSAVPVIVVDDDVGSVLVEEPADVDGAGLGGEVGLGEQVRLNTNEIVDTVEPMPN